MQLPPRPLMIFDGDCSFCRWWIERWRRRTGDHIDYAPYQDVADRFPEIGREAFKQAVHLVEPDGRVSRGAAAVFRALAHVPGRRWTWWMYRIPGVAWITERTYRFIARHRGGFFFVTRLLWGRDPTPSSFVLARDLFIRLVGVVFLIAFISLWTQIDGLIGSNGILPAREFLKLVHDNIGADAYWRLPSLCWIDCSDGFLHGLCVAGTILSLMLIIGIAPLITLAALWISYLSLVSVGQEFLSFQWDILLLETGFVSLFIAPPTPPAWWMRPWGARACPPPKAGMFLVRLLLFKLMFLSGITKLISGDPTWRDGTALNYHYFTQPIPTWTSWYAAQLPHWMQVVSLILMFAAELIVPFLIFGPRRVRHFAALALMLFQLLIAGTGNYGFFNLLAIVLCVPLLDDQLLRRFAPRRWTAWLGESMQRRGLRGWPCRVHAAAASVVAFASVLTFFREMQHTHRQEPPGVPGWASWTLDESDALLLSWGEPAILQWIDPFRTISGYGLFRVMTTQRPEINIEGSDDGISWKPYEFRWKAGDVKRPPRFVAPHQPRLDWQMWFAALSPPSHARVLQGLALGLLEGRTQVIGLLANDPFRDHAPRFIRFVFCRYEFTTFDERRATNAWWRSREIGRSAPISKSSLRR